MGLGMEPVANHVEPKFPHFPRLLVTFPDLNSSGHHCDVDDLAHFQHWDEARFSDRR